jgi:hypothetical protein
LQHEPVSQFNLWPAPLMRLQRSAEMPMWAGPKVWTVSSGDSAQEQGTSSAVPT